MFSEDEFNTYEGKAWVKVCPTGLSPEANLIWGLSNELASYVEMAGAPEELWDVDRDCHAQLYWAEEYLVKRRIPRPEPVARVLTVSMPPRKGRPRTS